MITGGLSPTTAAGAIAMPDVDFVKGVYTAGGKDYFDMLGVHAAGYKAPPELSPDEIAKDKRYNHGEGEKGRIYGFRHAEDVRQVMVANGDADKRVAILEFGWTSDPRPTSPYNWHAVSEACERGFTTFDFGRSELGAHGLRRYKDRWGAVERPLVYSVVGGRAEGEASPLPGAGLVAGLIRYAPVWVTRVSGELLYRYAA